MYDSLKLRLLNLYYFWILLLSCRSKFDNCGLMRDKSCLLITVHAIVVVIVVVVTVVVVVDVDVVVVVNLKGKGLRTHSVLLSS